MKVAVTLESLAAVLDKYIQSGDVSGPLADQLTNTLKQAVHQLDKGDHAKASKHVQDFIKHLGNPALSANLSDSAEKTLAVDAKALTDDLSKYEGK